MEIQRFLFYFKIILFFSFSSFERNFVAMPLKVRCYPPLNISGPHNRSPPLRSTSLTLHKTL